jgi:hypothetical protein
LCPPGFGQALALGRAWCNTGGAEGDAEKVKASSSFLKKRTKKLLIFWVRVAFNAHPNKQRFLLLFPKRSASLRPRRGAAHSIFFTAREQAAWGEWLLVRGL